MPPVARRLFLPDGPGPAGAGQALVSQSDGTLAWGTVPVPANAPGAGQVLTGTAGGGTQYQPYSGFPSAVGRAYATAAQNLANGWNTVALNTAPILIGGFQLSDNALIIPAAGYYQINVQALVSLASSPANILIGIGQNQTANTVTDGSYFRSPNGTILGLTCSDIISCNAGDEIYALIYDINSTDSIDLSYNCNYLSAARIA